MEVISFINHKGGVGKTTLCRTIAQLLAIIGKKVLVVDNDSQHNSTNGLGLSVKDVTIRHYYEGNYSNPVEFLRTAINTTTVANLHCITSDMGLSNSSIKSVSALQDLFKIDLLQQYYDFIFVDNHPGLDDLQRVSIAASNRLFIPVLPKKQSLDGAKEMVSYLKEKFHVPVETIVLIPNMVENIKLEQIIYESLKELFPAHLSKATIPLDRKIEEVEQQEKILFLDRYKTSKSVPAFISLIEELFELDGIHIPQIITTARKEHRSEIAKELFHKRGE